MPRLVKVPNQQGPGEQNLLLPDDATDDEIVDLVGRFFGGIGSAVVGAFGGDEKTLIPESATQPDNIVRQAADLEQQRRESVEQRTKEIQTGVEDVVAQRSLGLPTVFDEEGNFRTDLVSKDNKDVDVSAFLETALDAVAPLGITKVAKEVFTDVAFDLGTPISRKGEEFVQEVSKTSNPQATASFIEDAKFKSEAGDPMVFFRISDKVEPGANVRAIDAPRELGMHVGTADSVDTFTKGFEQRRKVAQKNVNIATERGEVAPLSTRITLTERPAVAPLITNVKSPLRMRDEGGVWSPAVVIKQLGQNPAFSDKKGALLDIFKRKNDATELASTADEIEAATAQAHKELQEVIQSKGFDSVIYTNTVEGAGDQSLILFDKSNFKFAPEL